MFKKVIGTTVLGISALGVMAANAAAPGVYVTGQLGYANTHMDAKTNTDYINRNTPLDIHTHNGSDSNLDNDGLAGRIALGYQFNPNFALEAGYLRLAKAKLDGLGEGEFPVTLKLQQNLVDLVAKGIVPIGDKFNLYGKAGLAYINTDIQAGTKDDNGNTSVSFDLNKSLNVNRHELAPEVALGVSYDITPNVSIDTSWTHIQPIGKNRPGNIDFIAVGLGYNFG
jgi:OOP family OmpA-OmpF porin